MKVNKATGSRHSANNGSLVITLFIPVIVIIIIGGVVMLAGAK